MNRKITSLGLALFAALALGAVAASTATAETPVDHLTAPQPWTPTVEAAPGKDAKGKPTGTQKFEFTTGENKGKSCEQVSATVTANIPATTDEATVIPNYEDCIAFNEGKEESSAFVETNECDYNFKGVTTKGNPTDENKHANLEIKNHVNPAEPCHIETKVTVFKFKCVSVPNQVIQHAVRYDNVVPEEGKKHVLLTVTAHGIESTTTNSIACPTGTGETETHDNGSYTGEVTVKAHNREGTPIDLEVQEEATEKPKE